MQRKPIHAVACLSVLLPLCGCHARMTATVTKAPNTLAPAAGSLSGIPFYNHIGACTQQTVWEEPRVTLTFSVAADDYPPVVKTMSLNGYAFTDATARGQAFDVNALVHSLRSAKDEKAGPENDSSNCPSVVAANWDEVATHDTYHVTPIRDYAGPGDSSFRNAIDHNNLVLAGNTATPSTVVDYSTVYFLNTTSPWNGTSSINAKIGADGTLTEGTVQKDDETLATTLNAVSTLGGDVVSAGLLTPLTATAGAAVPPAAGANISHIAPSGGPEKTKAPPPSLGCRAGFGWPAATSSVKYTFEITTDIYKHDHKRVTRDQSGCQPALYDGDSHLGVYGPDVQVAISRGETEKKAADQNAIGVNGTISLPKPKDDPK